MHPMSGVAAWFVFALAFVFAPGAGNASAASVERSLRELSKVRTITKDLTLVVGPAEGVTLPAGAVLSARFSGRASSAIALGRTARSERLGAGSVVVGDEAPQLTLTLSDYARRSLRRARALVGELELTLDAGERTTVRRRVSVLPLAPPRCFGAAARDPLHPCVNPALRRTVLPTPQDALLAPNAPCTPIQRRAPFVCGFGTTTDPSRPAIALIGDSHASHWRAALAVMADRERWRGISIARSGCALSTVVNTTLTAIERGQCRRWNRQTTSWLLRHPEIGTVFVSQNAQAGSVRRLGAASGAAGYSAAWRLLPRSVRRIVVIRDVPHNVLGTSACVERVRRRGGRTAGACAVPRAQALPPDPAVIAATRLHSPRVRVVDLTRYFCSPSSCFPVVGGALVHKDQDHMTDLFATTLGPYLQRHVDRALP